jgi:integrase/recombinase XerD
MPAAPAGESARYEPAALTVVWLEECGSDHTRRAYYRDLATWLAWCARTSLDPLRARRADVDAWKATLTVTGRDGTVRQAAASTVARRLAALSSWYRYLSDNDVATTNPVASVRRPRGVQASPLPALSAASAAALLDYAEERAERNDSEASWRDAALLAVLFSTGLRVSAVTGARIDDLVRESGHRVLRYAKKGGSRDYVALAPTVTTPLDRYLLLRARRVGVAVDRLTGPLLATAPHPRQPAKIGGKALVQRDVWKTLRGLARRAGLPEAETLTPHGARRTAGTVLLGHDVPLVKVQDLLGHADPRTTRDHYDAQRHRLDTSPVYELDRILAGHRQPRPDKPQ